jgi:hypothetical protein
MPYRVNRPIGRDCSPRLASRFAATEPHRASWLRAGGGICLSAAIHRRARRLGKSEEGDLSDERLRVWKRLPDANGPRDSKKTVSGTLVSHLE